MTTGCTMLARDTAGRQSVYVEDLRVGQANTGTLCEMATIQVQGAHSTMYIHAKTQSLQKDV